MKTNILLIALAFGSMVACKSGESSDVRDDIISHKEVSSTRAEGHNSKNSLDWAGVYEGDSFCDDCDNIKTVLRLNQDESFVLSQAFVRNGKEEIHYKEDGKFSWDNNGSDIIVESGKITIRFQVRENEVRMLDMKGNVVDAKLANFYTLQKK